VAALATRVAHAKAAMTASLTVLASLRKVSLE